ncbi:unnamed protein product [Closterium sp. Naga37s-1]|nr:unnamed protein product [Closterium sp. Naga37s-1]
MGFQALQRLLHQVLHGAPVHSLLFHLHLSRRLWESTALSPSLPNIHIAAPLSFFLASSLFFHRHHYFPAYSPPLPPPYNQLLLHRCPALLLPCCPSCPAPFETYYIAAPLSVFLAARPVTPSDPFQSSPSLSPSLTPETSQKSSDPYYIAAPLSVFLAGRPVSPSEPFSTTGADVISIACLIVGAAVFAWGNLHQHRCHAILQCSRGATCTSTAAMRFWPV